MPRRLTASPRRRLFQLSAAANEKLTTLVRLHGTSATAIIEAALDEKYQRDVAEHEITALRRRVAELERMPE